MTVRNSRSTGNSGGGIVHWGTSLNLTRVKVTGNSSPSGGGVSANAPFTMTDCVVSGNEATNGSGGGIFITGDSGAGNLTNVTISDNTSTGSGGGIHNQLKGTVTLSNVTITGNYASSGGAILNTNDCVMNLTNCTIAHNSYYTEGFGAGIVNYATTNFRNTIMAGNGGANCLNGGSSDVTNSYGGNLDSGDTCGFTQPSDYRNTDPLLAPLGNNGGYVETMALLTGSLAIDSGANTGYPSTDARGTPRPQDGNADGVVVCDIGAFERCQHKPAGILGLLIYSSHYYDSIGDAYAAVTGTTVISLQTYQFNEDVNLSNDYAVTLKGGFDCDYASNTGKFSVLNGSLTVSQGKVTLANLIIK
jgi:large repetitive protein